MQDNQKLLELCRKVSVEKDGGKMTELIRQLNSELDKASPKKPEPLATIRPKDARRA